MLHTPGTAREVDGLERIAAQYAATPDGHWLEPACGSARYLRVAARRGRRVTGFDLEPAMIAYARERFDALGLDAHLFEADMTDFARSMRAKAAFAFNTINTIRHLPNDDAMRAHFADTARALTKGGVYAVGMGVTLASWTDPVEDVWTARRGTTLLTQVVQYLPPTGESRTEQVLSHVTLATPTGERHSDSAYTLRAYTREQWLALIDSSDMELVATVDEDGYQLDPPEDGYALYVLRAR